MQTRPLVAADDRQGCAGAALIDPGLCAYVSDDDHIRILHDAAATHDAILEGVAWLAGRTAADPDATAIVYYSGHGWLDESSGAYYLVPHDVQPFAVADSALPAGRLQTALRAITACRLLVLLDCCHAEGIATAKDPAPRVLPSGFAEHAAPKALADALRQGEGRAVIASSRGTQRSWVRPGGDLSLFTHHLLEALRGACSHPGDTVVRLANLVSHLGQAVPASAQALCHAEQTPFLDAASEDFAVALLLGGKRLGATPPIAPATPSPGATIAAGERGIAIGDANSGQASTGDLVTQIQKK